MEFKSQICTTREQSERLLALGLKRETADAHYSVLPMFEMLLPFPEEGNTTNPIPAWSMHRLIELLSTSMFPYRVIDNDFPLYDSLIARIEWQIEEGYFPKEYLYEKEKETF